MSARSDAILEHQYALAGVLAALEGRLTQAVDSIRGQVINGVLFTGTVTLGADGTYSTSFEVPFGAVAIGNSTGGVLTFANDGPQISAPASGVGVMAVAAGQDSTFSIVGRDLTLYGPAGAVVQLAVYDRPQGAATLAPPASTLGAPAAQVLDGFASFAATTVATTLLTIPAGRTWVGTVGGSVAVSVAAAAATAGKARAVFSTAGAAAVPAAGTILALEAQAGANAATGTAGSGGNSAQTVPVTVIAPAANAVQLQVTTTITGTAGVVDAYALGALL